MERRTVVGPRVHFDERPPSVASSSTMKSVESMDLTKTDPYVVPNDRDAEIRTAFLVNLVACVTPLVRAFCEDYSGPRTVVKRFCEVLKETYAFMRTWLIPGNCTEPCYHLYQLSKVKRGENDLGLPIAEFGKHTALGHRVWTRR